MPSKEEEFKQRFAGVLGDLVASDDQEQRLLIGSLAARLAAPSNSPSWSAFKVGISLPAYRALLASFQKQGNELARQGRQEEVYAIEVLAVSLVAKTQGTDPEIASGTVVLDQLIDDAITLFQQAKAADPIIS
jgi:hypothetical protein